MKILIVPDQLVGRRSKQITYYYRTKLVAPVIKADIYDNQDYMEYDVIIFQKAFITDVPHNMAESFKGLKIMDVANPEWEFGDERNKQFFRMLEKMDCCVVASEAFKHFLTRFVSIPYFIIPDREDLTKFTLRKQHAYIENPLYVWHGRSKAFIRVLKTFMPTIKKKKYRLKIIGDRVNDGHSHHEKRYGYFDHIEKVVLWKKDTEYAELIEGDIGINPPWLVDYHKWATHAKSLKMWALGLPVATTLDELEKFRDLDERIKEAEYRLQWMKENYDVKLSKGDWENVLTSMLGRKITL
jgi:hypothetical protein